MHDTAYQIGRLFFQVYFSERAPSVLDVGSRDFNGTLRACVPPGTRYVGVDLEPGEGVDVVLRDPNRLPFKANSFDAILSSSCFEHDQMFWLTFLEMARVAKPGGFIYISAPSNGFYHSYPYDNWRFYPDAGLALIAWAKNEGLQLELIESFIARRVADSWNDCVLVFRKGGKRTRLPEKLLCDLLPAPFNIRRHPTLDIANLRAETEDMILLQEAKDRDAADKATSEQLLAEMDKVQHSLASSHEVVESLSAAFGKERDSIDETVRELREDATRSRSELDRVRAEAAAEQIRAATDLASERAEKLRQAEALRLDIERIRDEATRQTHALNASLEEQRRTFAAMTEVLLAQLRVAGFERERLVESINELRAETTRGKSELDRLRTEAAADQERAAAELDRLRTEATADQERAEAELDRLRTEAAAEQNRIASERGAERMERQQLLETLEAEMRRIQAEANAQLETTRWEADARLVEHQRDRDRLETQVIQLETHAVRFESQVQQLQQELETAQESKRQSCESLENQIRHIRDEVAGRIAERDQRIDALNARILRLLSSDSWRVTLPLRKVGALFSPNAQARLRWIPKSIYWVLTPHKIPARLRVMREKKARSHPAIEAPPEAQPPVNAAPNVAVARNEPQFTPLRVLYVSGDSASPSHAYRVENMARGLTEIGVQTEIVFLHEFWRAINRMGEFDVVVFWRLALGAQFHWSGDIEGALNECRQRGTTVFFDVDDLVFDSELCSPRYVDGLRYLNTQQRKEYDEGVIGYRSMMLACGNVLVSTEPLKRLTEKFGVQAFVVPNGLDAKYESALRGPPLPRRHHGIVIGYTPGTRTHQKDFATAAGALFQVLSERSDVRLRVLGPLDFADFPQFAPFLGKQVFVEEGVGRDKVFQFNQEIDINIAPLEMDNPFTAAKSELKYFEAAVFTVPTIASRVGVYFDVIRDGENGYSAATESEWLAALRTLVSNEPLRQRIGAAARRDVEGRYVARTLAQAMRAAFESVRHLDSNTPSLAVSNEPQPTVEVWPSSRDYRAERPIYVNWVVSGLIIGGGGHRMILRAAYHLSRFGHRVRIYFIETNQSAPELRQLIKKHFYPLECPVYVYDGTMKPADVIFATYWKTVKTALAHRDICREAMYFVQDFEPSFFPMGSDYIMAENTYREGMYAITAGPWCAHFLRARYNSSADSFVFPIQDVYHRRPRHKDNRNVLFFAKPEMPRRCYELGIEVLRHVHALRPDIEIILFGSQHIRPETLPFPATCVGVLSVDQLAELYSNADAGIAFSPTNPSAVPYEMLACGLTVIDMDLPGAPENFGGTRDIVLFADLLPHRMAHAITSIIDNPAEQQRRQHAGYAFLATFPDEEGMGRRIESLIVNRLITSGWLRSPSEEHAALQII
jgi:glycosyltransferase involved in cell wall biosynthesis/SAM-dependent methyltransferase